MSSLKTQTSAALLVLALLFAPTSEANAAVPDFVTFSGRLSDGTGWGMSGEVDLVFTLYDAETAGTALWEQSFTTVRIDDGYFSVTLGEGTDLVANQPAAVITVFEAYDEVWIGLAEQGYADFGPRKQIGSVPYAIRSIHADTAIHANTATLAEVASAVTCPQAPGAPSSFGFCIWFHQGSTMTFQQAAAACRSGGGRLCSLAELSAAQAAGAETCAYAWVADRTDNSHAYIAFPRQTVGASCGNAVGVISQPAAMTELWAATCCR